MTDLITQQREAQSTSRDTVAPRVPIRGIAAARGAYIGTARVISSNGDLRRLRSGDVLVCSALRPSWSPAFKSLGAVVADNGGLLCSAATIARECRIPAVVGTQCATSRVPDGARISVDGDRGVITILPD